MVPHVSSTSLVSPSRGSSERAEIARAPIGPGWVTLLPQTNHLSIPDWPDVGHTSIADWPGLFDRLKTLPIIITPERA